MSSDPKEIEKYYQDLAQKLLGGEISREEFVQKLTQLHLELESKADYDGLVRDFLNNHGFKRELDRMIKIVQRLGNIPATLLALDIDNLKKFNDSLGHPAGDRLIQTYSDSITQHTRGVDVKGRLGGDEFALFLVGADLEGALVVAERIRQSIIEAVKLAFPDLGWQQTISIGISQVLADDNPESLRDRADQALYVAKKEKNKVIIK